MADQTKTYDLNNLVLDDNTMSLLPEGSYRFKVDRHEIDYYSGNSDKIPANTQQIITYLEIPYTDETGHMNTVIVRNTLNVYAKAMFALRQFAECIGLCEEKGKFAFNVDTIDGKTGVCELKHRQGNNGNEFNNIDSCYPPSKAPKKCMNDDVWEFYEKGVTDVTVTESDNPW